MFFCYISSLSYLLSRIGIYSQGPSPSDMFPWKNPAADEVWNVNAWHWEEKPMTDFSEILRDVAFWFAGIFPFLVQRCFKYLDGLCIKLKPLKKFSMASKNSRHQVVESGTLWTLSTDLARQTQGFGFVGDLWRNWSWMMILDDPMIQVGKDHPCFLGWVTLPVIFLGEEVV